MTDFNNPVILAASQAADAVYNAFDAIWNAMNDGRKGSADWASTMKGEIVAARENLRQRYEKDLEALNTLELRLDAMHEAIQAAYSDVQNIVGDVIPDSVDEGEGEVPPEIVKGPVRRGGGGTKV